MTERDSKTGRFVRGERKRITGYNDPFRSGRTVDERTYRSSLETLESLNRAVAQAQSDVERLEKYGRHPVR